MKITVLVAAGDLRHMSGKHQHLCRRAFTKMEDAKAYAPTFLEKCRRSEGVGSMYDLDDKATVQFL